MLKTVQRGPSKSLYFSLGEWPRPPFTARIERAQFHRARSASKKGTWPLPPHPSETAGCTSTGDRLVCPLILLLRPRVPRAQRISEGGKVESPTKIGRAHV